MDNFFKFFYFFYILIFKISGNLIENKKNEWLSMIRSNIGAYHVQIIIKQMIGIGKISLKDKALKRIQAYF